MCQAIGKYPLFFPRVLLCWEFFPSSSVLVTAERTIPAFPMLQRSRLQWLSAVDLHHLEPEIFLEAQVIVLNEK